MRSTFRASVHMEFGLRSARVGVALLLAGWLGACAAENSGTMEPGGTNRVSDGLQAMIETALADASRRTGRPRSEWSVVAAEAVTWRSGALGCPQPGMLYTDALVPGYRIVIEAAGQRLDYHASAQGEPLLCPADRAEEPAPVDSSGMR